MFGGAGFECVEAIPELARIRPNPSQLWSSSRRSRPKPHKFGRPKLAFGATARTTSSDINAAHGGVRYACPIIATASNAPSSFYLLVLGPSSAHAARRARSNRLSIPNHIACLTWAYNSAYLPAAFAARPPTLLRTPPRSPVDVREQPGWLSFSVADMMRSPASDHPLLSRTQGDAATLRPACDVLHMVHLGYDASLVGSALHSWAFPIGASATLALIRVVGIWGATQNA